MTSIWRDDGGAVFQTAKPDGTVVIDRGRVRVSSVSSISCWRPGVAL